MLNIGFVGLGHNGLAHVEAHLRLGKSRIVASCDRSPERLRDQVALARNEQDVHPPLQPLQAKRVQGHAYEPEIEDWLDAIAQDRPTRTGLYDGANSTLATLRACLAIEQAQSVDVPVLRA